MVNDFVTYICIYIVSGINMLSLVRGVQITS